MSSVFPELLQLVNLFYSSHTHPQLFPGNAYVFLEYRFFGPLRQSLLPKLLYVLNSFILLGTALNLVRGNNRKVPIIICQVLQCLNSFLSLLSILFQIVY